MPAIRVSLRSVISVLMLLLFLQHSIFLRGQEKSFLSFKKFDQGAGLSSSNIRKIIQDEYGFIWIATQDGLNRFDGADFIQFNAKERIAGRVTGGSDFHDVVSDGKRGFVWAATSNGGINKIDIAKGKVDTVFYLASMRDSLEVLWYKSFCLKDDSLYVATYQGSVFKINLNTNRVEKRVYLPSLVGEDCSIDKVFVDEEGFIWLFTEQKGVVVLNTTMSGVVKNISAHQLMPGKVNSKLIFSEILSCNPKELIAATNYGIVSFSTKEKTIVKKADVLRSIPHEMAASETYSLSMHDRMLYISNSTGIYKIDMKTGTYRQLQNAKDIDDRKWFSNVYSLFANNQQLWLGNQQGLALIKDIETPFTAFHSSFSGNHVKLSHCYFLYPISDSVVFSCAADGLYYINTHTSAVRVIDTSQAYYQVFRLVDGSLLASGPERMIVFKGHNIKDAVSEYAELRRVNGDFIIASANYKDSIVFMASQNDRGLYVWDLKKRSIRVINDKSLPVSLKNLRINSLFIDADNILWIVCNNVISMYDFLNNKIRHQFIRKSKQGPVLNIIMDACKAGANYYLAVYGEGVVEVDNQFQVKKILSVEKGITNTGCYKIFSYNDTLILASSNNGIFLYNRHTERVKKISDIDGLQSNAFDETSGNKWNDAVFFGGLNGFTRIFPEKIKDNITVPRCYFLTLRTSTQEDTKDTTYLFMRQITIPHNFTQVNVKFIGIDYANPEKIVYAYRINELNKSWTSNNTQNFIDLIGLSPGTYHLQVKAANEDGVWSKPIELTLTFLPKWYQTWWFKIAILLAVVAIAYGFYRMRINQMKREERIRRKLASDLHDDLGSTLNSVKVYASLAMSDRNDASYLLKIKESTQEAISGIRDIIWVLDDKRDTIEHIIGRVRQFAQPLCEANGITFATQIDEHLYDYKLGKEEKRNLYMIMKESINNSIKYAACKHIEVVIASASGRLSVRITDDGAGFDIKTITFGNGIKNIETRAKEVGYKANVVSSPGNGTLVHLQKS